LIHARANGLKKPFETNAEFDSAYKKMVENYELVEVKDSKLYHLKTLKHSHPYLIPEAVSMLDEIAVRFQAKLKEQKLGNYCFFLTSILRTVKSQEKTEPTQRECFRHHCSLFCHNGGHFVQAFSELRQRLCGAQMGNYSGINQNTARNAQRMQTAGGARTQTIVLSHYSGMLQAGRIVCSEQ